MPIIHTYVAMLTSYIIHMSGSTARRPLVDALCQVLPNPQVLDAVVGRDLSDSERAAIYTPNLFRPAYPFPLSVGEIGCFLSHRKAWQRIVDSGDPFGLVSEDDVVPEEGFETALDLAMAHAGENRLIRLPMADRETAVDEVAQSGICRLVRPDVVGLTAAVQVVGRDAAQRLLELTERFDRPVDTFQQMRWITGIDMMTVLPSVASAKKSQSGGSTIQTRQPLWAEIKRSWHRARYRAAVKKLSGMGG